jgi:hypothetical protein
MPALAGWFYAVPFHLTSHQQVDPVHPDANLIYHVPQTRLGR